MIVLLTGASGFIGSHLARALAERGHHVVCATRGRQPEGCQRRVDADFSHDHDPAAWHPRLAGVEAVVNTVGIFQERGEQTFEALHVHGPMALFKACADLGIHRVVQVSALGADDRATTPYHHSKKQCDDQLLALIPEAVVVQPSLVFGADGVSARWFTMMASLPFIPVPAGQQWVQPVHIKDVVAAITRLLEAPEQNTGRRVVLVGPSSLTLRDYLAALRKALGLRPARFLPIPRPLVRMGAWLGSRVRLGLLDEQSWRMLERGNVGSPLGITALLGGYPRPTEKFIPSTERPAALSLARLAWLLPMLKLSMATVWIVTGIVSAWVYPVEDSLALLDRTGVPANWSPLMLYGAAGLDLALGVATLLAPGRRLWLAQAALIAFYTAVISWRLPEFWSHPYGPILKNIPMLAVLAFLYIFEERK